MDRTSIYYLPPTNKIFSEVKKAAIKVWSNYDDTYGYASGKIDSIKDIGNIGDNLMFIVAMFDINNQTELAFSLSPQSRKAISDRMKEGGLPDMYNPFLEYSE